MNRLDGRPVIIGGGVAGLVAALCLAPRPVVVLCAGAFGAGTSSGWAQGGIAAAIGADDSPALHAADTIAAGAGLCDPAVVARITGAGAWAIAFLQRHGVKFSAGLGLEAAHAQRRIVHAQDATGAEMMRALVAAVRATPSITVLEQAEATALAVRDGQICGVRLAGFALATSHVVLATGGVGGLFAHTTNPAGATGSGLALAARAGARLRDLEFVQFHPTALACGLDPMPLLSEALRGEGAVFTDQAGRRLMPGRDLAPRDVVARAVAASIAQNVPAFLDARALAPARFPKIFALCRAQGLDPATSLLPVRPAAHYHMGGIAVDAHSQSSVDGLFACGEAAATGLHGANRLASNSLLEACVTGRDAAEAISGQAARRLTAVAPAAACNPAGLPIIRALCSRSLGILRDNEGLQSILHQLQPLTAHSNPALVAWLMADAAWRRRESRGAHYRTDFPAADAGLAVSSDSRLPEFGRAA